MLEKGAKATTLKESMKPSLSATPQIKSSPLASPSMGKKFLATSLLVSEKIQKKEIPKDLIKNDAQNALLKYALGSESYEKISKEDSKRAEGAGLKSSVMASEAKSKRLMEIAKLQEDLNIDYNAVRMPNSKTKVNFKATKVLEEEKKSLNVIMDDNPTNNLLRSPSTFLKGAKKVPKELGKICICGRMPVMEGEDSCMLCEKKDIKMEGYLLRKAKKKNKLK